MKYSVLTALLLITIRLSFAQGVAINTDDSNPDGSAMLDVKSTTGGVLIPRLTSSQRDAISTPATGLMIYNTDRKCLEFYSGIEWNSAVPLGTIEAFGGGSVPDGWLLCDGTEVGRTTYTDLFATISISWGGGDGVNTFNLPDLRGRFLRGQDGGSGVDLDVASRIALFTSGNTGDNVGSYQNDNLKSHKHSIVVGATTNLPFTYVSTQATNLFGSRDTDLFGGNETRPKNAYVVFIIKY